MENDREQSNISPNVILPKSWKFKLAAIFTVLLISGISFEGLAWGLYAFRDSLYKMAALISPASLLQLDPYEVPALDQPGHWRLKPGYDARGSELLQAKNSAGKWLGVDALRETQSSGLPDRLTVNSKGFKGPMIDTEHKCPRLLSVGDSVTFGIGGISYPYFLQKELRTLDLNVEVINAGVEGYSPRNLLFELPRYRALKPDVVTIYIGWNALYSTDMATAYQGFTFKSPWLVDRLKASLSHLTSSIVDEASLQYHKVPKLDPDVSRRKKWPMEKMAFTKDVEQLIKAFRAMGAKVYVMTLFGLFQSDREPTKAALNIGHLPPWTDNPYDLAAVVDQYNMYLHHIAARSNVALIDFQAWGRKSLQPPESYFFDSVHFNPKGLRSLGKFLAEALVLDASLQKPSCVAER